MRRNRLDNRPLPPRDAAAPGRRTRRLGAGATCFAMLIATGWSSMAGAADIDSSPAPATGVSTVPEPVKGADAESTPPHQGPAAETSSEPSPASALPASDSAEHQPKIAEDVREILAKPEFRRVRGARRTVRDEPDSRLPTWLIELLKYLFPESGDATVSVSWLGLLIQSGVYAVLGVVVGLAAWFILRAVRQGGNRASHRKVIGGPLEEGALQLAPGERPADLYEQRAQELAGRAAYAEAIGQLILGAMSRTERDGRLRFRPGLTYQDYVRAWKGMPSAQAAWRRIVSVYEPIGFGRRLASEVHYQTCLDSYRAGFLNV